MFILEAGCPGDQALALASDGKVGWDVDVDELDEERVREVVLELMRAQHEPHQDALRRVTAE